MIGYTFHTVLVYSTNIFLESTGDATFSGTLGLKFTTDPDENVNSRGTMALQVGKKDVLCTYFAVTNIS